MCNQYSQETENRLASIIRIHFQDTYILLGPEEAYIAKEHSTSLSRYS